MADYSTMSPSLASNNDGSDEEPTQTLRYVMGIFMLLITLFVLFFAFWTYMIHIKRMFSQVRVNSCLNKTCRSVIGFLSNSPLFL